MRIGQRSIEKGEEEKEARAAYIKRYGITI
jgi:hypothetical protein